MDVIQYFHMGRKLFSMQKYEQAIDSFSKAIQIQPDYYLFYYERGNAYYFIRQWKFGLRDYNKALSLNPYFAIGYVSRGCVHLKINQYKLAKDDFTVAIRLWSAYTDSGVSSPANGEEESVTVPVVTAKDLLDMLKEMDTFIDRMSQHSEYKE